MNAPQVLRDLIAVLIERGVLTTDEARRLLLPGTAAPMNDEEPLYYIMHKGKAVGMGGEPMEVTEAAGLALMARRGLGDGHLEPIKRRKATPPVIELSEIR